MIKRILSFFQKKEKLILNEFDDGKKEEIFRKIKDLTGLQPQNEHYFLKAFTHRSYLEKSKVEIKSNERLEFLGDSILGKVTAEYLFINYPNEEEGFLTKTRSQFVNKNSLEKIGFNLKLHELIFVYDKYLLNDKKKLSNIVADCLEALIAAIYLEFGEEITKDFIIEYIVNPQIENGEIHNDKNYKGQLLEFAHANKFEQPIYKIINEIGPQHDKIYTVEVYVNNQIKGIGKGSNKKNAEQNAAKDALEKSI
ncbi:MAG: ribonuclease III [Ignavibacteriae bacterium]|nr:ribonuclease III [Ignavibacteriota bacterium]MCB9205788.1 ribonuclease III [Ignavibacteriales bacterium]MCB9209950.1 ribonuclease III [Ignavibacteriales bacterium]MCB9219335.1 ribonuclease III [Ignavibacteriales bacterium]MCB9260222.1 ribonuclease III [Ignavibacteriales bacterium]